MAGMYERPTSERCPRGFPVRLRPNPFYIEQQDEPYDVEWERVCCDDCEMFGPDYD